MFVNDATCRYSASIVVPGNSSELGVASRERKKKRQRRLSPSRRFCLGRNVRVYAVKEEEEKEEEETWNSAVRVRP